MPHLRNNITYDHDFRCTGVKWWYLQAALFSFFWNFYFLSKSGGKRAKNSPKWKITVIHPSRAISQEQYSIWSWFLVHFCKMIIYLGISFYFFKICFFLVFRGVKGQEIVKKWQKILFVMLHVLVAIHHMIFIYGTHV